MSQNIQNLRRAVLDVCAELFEDERDTEGGAVLVANGPPGKNLPNYVVMVGKQARQTISRPTLGADRSRERAVELSITVSAFVPGADTEQQDATDAHDHLIDLIETYFRGNAVNGEANARLGGACRDSWISEIDGPILDAPFNAQTKTIRGRVAESVVTLTAFIRY